MSPLGDFKTAFLKAIAASNLELSGVATVFDAGGLRYSASCAVVNQGDFPDVKAENYGLAVASAQKTQVCGYRFMKLYGTNFIMSPDLIGARWQMQYIKM